MCPELAAHDLKDMERISFELCSKRRSAHLDSALHAGLRDLPRRPHVQQHPAVLHELCRVLRCHIAHLALCHLLAA